MSFHLEHLTWMPSPPLVPDEAIDFAHLKRMTLGEPALEDEVLSLFAGQSSDLMRRLNALPEDAAALAHTLKGSARAIGAFRVADAARDVEAALRGQGGVAQSLAALTQAVEEARTAIARLQGRA
jgi:HPt (histidine-containing phosphotransfer) domain-containing protein